MSKATKALTAISALAIAFIAATSAQAAVICDEDGCRRAVIISEPTIIVVDDDCGC